MASEIEQLANSLRALASHAGGTGREIGQAAQASEKLVEAAHAQGRSGLAVGSLVGQLQTAAKRARAAAAAIEQVAAHGESFADHLAATRHSDQDQGFRNATLAAFTASIVGTTPMPDVTSTEVSGDVGTHQVADAATSIDNAASQHDRWEAANDLAKRRSDDITEVRRKK
jgi:hypothetical protein